MISLKLDCYRISDAGAIKISEAINQQSLKVTELYLGNNQITVVGIVSLCQAITEVQSSKHTQSWFSPTVHEKDETSL